MPDANRYLRKLIPAKCDSESYKKLNHIRNNIVDFVNKPENLLIVSDCIQNCKTTWSLKLMYRYFHEIWAGSDYISRGYFINVPKFLDDLKNYSYRNTPEFMEIDKNIKNVDLVIWDDITTYKLQESDQILLNIYVSYRNMHFKANIFNGLDNGQIKENVGEILSARLDRAEKNCS